MDFMDPVIIDFGGAHSRLIPWFVDKFSCWKPLVEWEKTCKPQRFQKTSIKIIKNCLVKLFVVKSPGICSCCIDYFCYHNKATSRSTCFDHGMTITSDLEGFA